MKLRTRLFLWFGGLFILFVVVSYFLEIYLVHRNITKSSNALHVQIEKDNESFRKHFENFLGSVIADIQARVDVLLFRLNQYSVLKEDFMPTEENLKRMTWVPSSQLILRDKWVHFIQSTIEGHLTALINPTPDALFPVQSYKIDRDLAWIAYQEKGEKKASLAIRFSRSDFAQFPTSYVDVEIQEEPDVYFLFDPQTIRRLSTDGVGSLSSKPRLNSEVFLHFRKLMIAKIDRAKVYLRNEMPTTNSKYPYEVKKWLNRVELKPVFKRSVFAGEISEPMDITPTIMKEFRTSFQRDFNRDHVVTMISLLTSSLMTDLFGKDPLDPQAPKGIAIVPMEGGEGGTIWSREVFSKQPFYDDGKYVKSSAFGKNKDMPASIALIIDPKDEHLFLGNTLVMRSGGNTGYLSVGMDMNDLIQRLALATNQVVVLASNNKVLGIYDENGKKNNNSCPV